jgi:hypothetical protein
MVLSVEVSDPVEHLPSLTPNLGCTVIVLAVTMRTRCRKVNRSTLGLAWDADRSNPNSVRSATKLTGGLVI